MRRAVAAGRICTVLLFLLVDIATPALALEPENAVVRTGHANNVGDTTILALGIEFVPGTIPSPLTLLGDDLSLDLTVGYIDDANDADGGIQYIHLGPTWHYRPAILWSGVHLDVGTAITRLSGDRVNERLLGGHWHFTSHVSLGHDFGEARRWHAAIRLQHTSNASTQDPNPGLDVPMLELGYHF